MLEIRSLKAVVVLLASIMSITTGAEDEKTVLISLGPRTRPVTFGTGSDALEKAIREAFADSPLLSASCRVIVQVRIAASVFALTVVGI